MSPMSFEEDLATCGSEVGTTVVNGGRRHEAQSRVPVRVVVVVVAEIAAEQATVFCLPVSANAINKDVGVHTKMSLNVRHHVVSAAGIAERTASLEIRLNL